MVGIFAALLTDYAIASAAGGAAEQTPWGGAAWRWMFASAVIPAAAWAVLALRIPESPRYLVRKGQEDDARTVLARFVGGDVAARVEAIKETLAGRIGQVRLSDLRGPRLGLLPIVWVGILLSVFQQFVGINVIFYYSTTLWESVGFSSDDAFLTSTITSVTNIVVTIIAILLVDKIGRRRLLLIGSLGMFVTLALMAVAFSTATLVENADGTQTASMSHTWSLAAFIGANGFVVFFGATWGPVMWVLLGEMFPNSIRAVALAVAGASNWIANFIVTITFPSLSTFSLSAAYGLYALMSLLSFFFVVRRIRETKGVELEAMTDTGSVQRVVA